MPVLHIFRGYIVFSRGIEDLQLFGFQSTIKEQIIYQNLGNILDYQ